MISLSSASGSQLSKLIVPWLRWSFVLAPILLGGWFLFVAVASYTELIDRSPALPQQSNTAPFLDDFVVFHAAGGNVSEVGGAIYDPATMSALEADTTSQDPGRVTILPFFNPPSALLLFSVVGLLPLKTAAAVWLVGGLIVALTAIRRLGRELGWSLDDTTLLLALGVCSSLPFHQTLVHGQMTFLLLAGFCFYGVGILKPQGGPYLMVGLLLLAFKPVLLPLPIIYLLLRREYRLLAAFAVVEAILVLAAAAIFDPRLPYDYMAMSLKAVGWDEVNGISTYGMFGWTGFWRGILGPDSHELQSMLTALSSVATISAFAWTFRRGVRPRLALPAIVLGALLISPHSYAQDLLFLIVPLLALVTSVSSSRWAAVAITCWFAAYAHFQILGLSGVGSANLALLLMFGYGLLAAQEKNAETVTTPQVALASRRLDNGLSSADAAGS
jgi:Glycosyltransferase family 87